MTVMRVKRSEVVYEGRLVRVRRDVVELGGRERTREVVEHPGSVVVMPLLGDRVVAVKQYRHAIGEVLLELPAGTLEPGERPEECALRELEEETGYTAGALEELGSFYASPGYTSEILFAFLASDLRPSRRGREPWIEVVEIPLRSLLEMVKVGEIRDSKTISTIMLYLVKARLLRF